MAALQTNLKVIERSTLFKDHPYDFLLEICGVSNTIAANYAISEEQHKALILSAIPTTSVLAKELQLLSSLDHIFSLASLNASSIYSKAELEAKLEGWHLSHNSY